MKGNKQVEKVQMIETGQEIEMARKQVCFLEDIVA